jgi:hypothetical protein
VLAKAYTGELKAYLRPSLTIHVAILLVEIELINVNIYIYLLKINRTKM